LFLFGADRKSVMPRIGVGMGLVERGRNESPITTGNLGNQRCLYVSVKLHKVGTEGKDSTINSLGTADPGDQTKKVKKNRSKKMRGGKPEVGVPPFPAQKN